MTNDPYEPKGKGKKAQYRLNAIDKEITIIKGQLDNARDALLSIVVKQDISNIEGVDKKISERIWKELKANGLIDKNGNITDNFKPNEKEIELNIKSFKGVKKEDIIKVLRIFVEQKKRRSMVANVPNRIEFPFNFLKFYIDFTMEASEGDDATDIKGSIIYGTMRTICFSECIFPNKSNDCKNCERIARCDRLEDKPLAQFSVNRNGIIKSKDKFEDEMWTTEIEDLLDLHYRILDLIWKDALDWANEIVLP